MADGQLVTGVSKPALPSRSPHITCCQMQQRTTDTWKRACRGGSSHLSWSPVGQKTYLTWKSHLKEAEKKFMRSALMKKPAGTSWGANSNILKRVYVLTNTPLEYGMSLWTTAAKKNKPSGKGSECRRDENHLNPKDGQIHQHP